MAQETQHMTTAMTEVRAKKPYFDRLPPIDESNLQDDGSASAAFAISDRWRIRSDAAAAQIAYIVSQIDAIPIMKEKENRRRTDLFQAELVIDLDKYWASIIADLSLQVDALRAELAEAIEAQSAWNEIGFARSSASPGPNAAPNWTPES